MTLADYIRRNTPVVVSVETRSGWHEYAVHDASELPFRADSIHGLPTNYRFLWDRVGKPTDQFGKEITRIVAEPQTERPQAEKSVFV